MSPDKYFNPSHSNSSHLGFFNFLTLWLAAVYSIVAFSENIYIIFLQRQRISFAYSYSCQYYNVVIRPILLFIASEGFPWVAQVLNH